MTDSDSVRVDALESKPVLLLESKPETPTRTQPKKKTKLKKRSKPRPKAKKEPKIKLVEVWKGFDPLRDSKLKVKGTDRAYDRVLRVILKDGKDKLTPEAIANGIKFLVEKYAPLGYYVQGCQIGRRKLYRIGREVIGEPDIALYINTKTGKLYLQDSHIKKDRARCAYVLQLRLGAIGVKTSTHLVSSKRIP